MDASYVASFILSVKRADGPDRVDLCVLFVCSASICHRLPHPIMPNHTTKAAEEKKKQRKHAYLGSARLNPYSFDKKRYARLLTRP